MNQEAFKISPLPEHSFASDNNTGIHPAAWLALQQAAQGQCLAYGDDPWTAAARARFCQVLGADVEVLFFLTGTAANMVAVAAMLQPWEALITSYHAHLYEDECGAPEKFSGCKIIPVDRADGKLTPEDVEPLLAVRGDVHRAQPRAISITQSTEFGRVYTLKEIRTLADYVHRHGMYLHMDGARLANACASLGCTLKEMIIDTGVDIVSLGGTKNGLLHAEALIVVHPALRERAQYLQKQAGQLVSKMRFVAAQFLAYLHEDLYLQLAAHANAMARELSQQLARLPGLRLAHPTEANGVFVYVPLEKVEALRKGGYFYLFDERTGMARLMCNYATELHHVELLVDHWARVLS
ncbi:MAG: beta-eliminating lyase-related protein [Flavobacteriales bacterium]|nr:beta-eliminating lyase-related protein [Flavobacteriales bacterium]